MGPVTRQRSCGRVLLSEVRADGRPIEGAQDYGDVRLSVNGRALSPIVRGYAPAVEPTGPISFGRVALRAGTNDVVLEIVGKDPRSRGYSEGYLVGIDGFLITR